MGEMVRSKREVGIKPESKDSIARKNEKNRTRLL